MALSDLARTLYAEKFINFVLGTLTNVDKDADNAVCSFIAPRNIQLTGIGVSWGTADSAAGGLTAKITKADGTVLASSGAGTPSATASGAYTDGYDVTLTKGTVYLLTIRSVADTDDFTSADIILCCEAPKTE